MSWILLALTAEKKLHIEIRTGGREGKIEMWWHQKECSAGIFCNERSDIDEQGRMIKNV